MLSFNFDTFPESVIPGDWFGRIFRFRIEPDSVLVLLALDGDRLVRSSAFEGTGGVLG